MNLLDVMKEKINANYTITAHFIDPETGDIQDIRAGSIVTEFQGGDGIKTNTLGREDFRLYDKIINIFDDPPAVKGPFFPFAACFTMVCLFMYFMT